MVEKPITQCTACYLSFGIICCVIALAVVAISFATDEWINCQVKDGFADTWISSPLYNCTYCPEMFYTRNRGLFRTCYPGSGVQYMIHAHWSLFLSAIVLLLISVILGVVGCWMNKAIFFASVSMILAALSIAAGMALFHGYYDLEKDKIIQAPMYGLVLRNDSYLELRNVTSCGFGISYDLGWVGLVACTASFCLLLSMAINTCLSSRPPSQPKPIPKIVQPEPPKQPPRFLMQQDPTYSFFYNVAHHSNQPTTYPIPLNPYGLHLPTGILPARSGFETMGSY